MLGALKKHKRIRNAPEFWWSSGLTLPAVLLYPISFIYGRITGRRMLSKPKAVSEIPIVCVGNFVVGGTGKTPFAIALYKLLSEKGFSPVFMLRGYGGNLKGPVTVKIGSHSAIEVGDEAMLLAANGPTIVAQDRIKGLETAGKCGHDIIILDDGFQNPGLKKDVAIVLVDSEVGIGNGKCLPAGPLRAPLDAQIRKTDILAVIGDGNGADQVIRKAARRGLMPNAAHLEPIGKKMEFGESVLAYSGIARPKKFFDTARSLGFELVHEFAFPDHHVFSESEIEELLGIAEEESLTLLTTSKDKSRLTGLTSDNARILKNRSKVLEVEMRICQCESFWNQIQEVLKKKTNRRC